MCNSPNITNISQIYVKNAEIGRFPKTTQFLWHRFREQPSRIRVKTGIRNTAPTGLLGAPFDTPSEAHGSALPPGDGGSHPTIDTTARTGDGSEHCHRDCPRDSFTCSETWKESGPWHMGRTTESCPWSGHAQQDQTGRNREARSHAGTGCPR